MGERVGDMVKETVSKVEGLLSEAVDLQKDYVERICGECEAPCCTRVHYLFNEKDILFCGQNTSMKKSKRKWGSRDRGQAGSWAGKRMSAILNAASCISTKYAST